MKIAITGHSSGIGKSFASYLSNRGHEIVGLSSRNGHNIRNIHKIAEHILPCDMWINNAQAGFAQTELFYHVFEKWHNDSNKIVWIISTIMASEYRMPDVTGLSKRQLSEYRTQKRALEDAAKTVRQQGSLCRICLIRPGAVATQSYNIAGENASDVDIWVKTVCDFYIQCRENNLFPEELSLSFKKEAVAI